MRLMAAGFTFLLACSAFGAQDPSTGLRPGESIRFQLRTLMLFGDHGRAFSTTRTKNLFFEFEYCVWTPRNANAAQYTELKCRQIRKTKYWTLAVKNSASPSVFSTMVATLDLVDKPSFSFSDLDLDAQRRQMNPDGEFPSALRVKLRHAGTWNSTLGENTLMLPVRGPKSPFWPSRFQYREPTRFDFKTFNVDGKDAKSLFFVQVLDDKGEAAVK